MSRRQYTRIRVSVDIRVPQGSTPTKTVEYIKRRLCSDNIRTDGEVPPNLDTDSMQVRLEKKETVYL